MEDRFQPTRTVTTERASRVPAGLKLAYTAYMAVLVPVYLLRANQLSVFLRCPLILTLIAIWREDAPLVSMCCVGIVLPQLFWVADFLPAAKPGVLGAGGSDDCQSPSPSRFVGPDCAPRVASALRG